MDKTLFDELRQSLKEARAITKDKAQASHRFSTPTLGVKISPNAETIAAMKAARRGELVTVGSPENLLVSLNADG